MKLKEFARESKKNFNGSKKDVPIVGLEHLNSGEMLFSDYDLNTENTFTKSFSKGQVLFGRRRAYLKKAAFAEFDGICSGDITVIEAIPGKVLPELLPFIIQNDKLFDFAISRSAGGLSPRVKWKDLAEFEFDLPSLADQKKLADKLWAAYRLKESYKKLLASMNELAKSRFIEMFGQCGEDRFGWGVSKLGDCCIINPSKSSEACLEDELEVSFCPMPYVSESGDIKTDETKLYKDVKSGFTYFAEGDILFAKITPCMENGKGAIARNLKNGIGFGSTEFHILRPNRSIITPEWLYVLTTFKQFRKDAEANMTGSAGQRRVPSNFLRNYKISIPPLEVQKQYVGILEQLDKSKSELKKSIAAIDDVIKSLIN